MFAPWLEPTPPPCIFLSIGHANYLCLFFLFFQHNIPWLPTSFFKFITYIWTLCWQFGKLFNLTMITFLKVLQWKHETQLCKRHPKWKIYFLISSLKLSCLNTRICPWWNFSYIPIALFPCHWHGHQHVLGSSINVHVSFHFFWF